VVKCNLLCIGKRAGVKKKILFWSITGGKKRSVYGTLDHRSFFLFFFFSCGLGGDIVQDVRREYTFIAWLILHRQGRRKIIFLGNLITYSQIICREYSLPEICYCKQIAKFVSVNFESKFFCSHLNQKNEWIFFFFDFCPKVLK
jgi:hypothetical protein